MKLKATFIILFILLAAGSLLLLRQPEAPPSPAKGAKPPAAPEQQKEPGQKPPKDENSVALAAAGDVLLHEKVYNDARTGTDTYNFQPMLAAVKPYIEEADAAFVNQESIVGGSEIGLSSYPSFNSPTEIADTLRDTGFDVIGTANNHALDRGEKALRRSLSYWDQLGLLHVGTHTSPEDKAKIRTFTRKNITFSVLAYTFGTNGIRAPKSYLVNYINRPAMQRDIIQAKKASDAVIVLLHFGNEYETLPNEEQQSLAQFLADQGVSIIFAHHPHVLQPPAFLTGKDGQQTFVAYSLGNFLAGQDREDTWFGGIVGIQAKKEADGRISLHTPSFLPTFTYSNQGRGYRVLPLDQVTPAQYPDAQARYNKVVQHMKTYIPELFITTTK